MIILFSTCKPFTGLIAVLQRNAFRNWSKLKQTQVVIFGDEEGTSEASAQFGFTHVGDVELGPQGYPLIPAMFETVQKLYPESAYLFTNSDMIYRGVEDALNHLVGIFPEFLMVGIRQDVRVAGELAFRKGWVESLRSRGKFHPPCGVDYFGFTSNLWGKIPDFQVGNLGFDNWLVEQALKSGKPVVDVTEVVDAFHQRHPPRTSENRPGDRYNLGFFKSNRGRTRGWVTHATYVLEKDGIRSR